MFTSILKSKTVWYAILLAILSVLQGSLNIFNLTPLFQMYVGMGISVGIVILRVLTTQPLLEK